MQRKNQSDKFRNELNEFIESMCDWQWTSTSTHNVRVEQIDMSIEYLNPTIYCDLKNLTVASIRERFNDRIEYSMIERSMFTHFTSLFGGATKLDAYRIMAGSAEKSLAYYRDFTTGDKYFSFINGINVGHDFRDNLASVLPNCRLIPMIIDRTIDETFDLRWAILKYLLTIPLDIA